MHLPNQLSCARFRVEYHGSQAIVLNHLRLLRCNCVGVVGPENLVSGMDIHGRAARQRSAPNLFSIKKIEERAREIEPRLQLGKELRSPDPVCAFVVSSKHKSTADKEMNQSFLILSGRVLS